VCDTANSTTRATAAVNTQALDKELVAALLKACRALRCIASGRVDNGVDSQLAVGNIVAWVCWDAAAKLAAMVDDLLKERLSLGKREVAVSNVLIKRANGWVVANVVDVNAGDMLSVAKGLAGIDGPDLGNELAESAFVANAKATASAVDA
jgi:hypothetical protein